MGRLAGFGQAYRLVQLRLADVTDLGAPVALAPILRQEPMVYLRLRPEFAQRSLQFQPSVAREGTAWNY